MSEKRYRHRKRFNNENTETEFLLESNEYLGFIAGYTSNGFPYGLTHKEWNEINADLD